MAATRHPRPASNPRVSSHRVSNSPIRSSHAVLLPSPIAIAPRHRIQALHSYCITLINSKKTHSIRLRSRSHLPIRPYYAPPIGPIRTKIRIHSVYTPGACHWLLASRLYHTVGPVGHAIPSSPVIGSVICFHGQPPRQYPSHLSTHPSAAHMAYLALLVLLLGRGKAPAAERARTLPHTQNRTTWRIIINVSAYPGRHSVAVYHCAGERTRSICA